MSFKRTNGMMGRGGGGENFYLLVIASGVWQSSVVRKDSGLPRRVAPRNDGVERGRVWRSYAFPLTLTLSLRRGDSMFN